MITTFQLANMIFTGADSLIKVPESIKAQGLKKPLIVTDKGVVKVGLLKKVTDVLESEGIPYAVYDETVPNPNEKNAEDSFNLYKKEDCDCLIGLGGGSPMDTAKACGILATSGGTIDYYRGMGLLKAPLPFYIAIPTTAGTGSESTCAAIITNTKDDHHWKMVILDGRLLPDVAVIDPVLMLGLPPAITASTGMDAMTHAIEAYLSVGSMEYSNALALGAIELVFKYLGRAVGNGNDLEAREKMAYAQTMAGMAFSNAGLGLVHSMAHPLSAFYHIAHGFANAVCLPTVLDYNKSVCPEKMAKIAQLGGITDLGNYPEDAGVEVIQRLNDAVGIPRTITEVGAMINVVIDPKDIESMSKDALNEVSTITTPKVPNLNDVVELYTKIW
ncbi:iron-containing alcohol dehydrogenase [Maridesulfovibrio sp.]|uniref:iron-containing alcohol dehydrogenase n=1 Tax=Maridesulfovibrio sp. TaxID=2795000 RepID=UPI0039EF2861